jgi:hypothetical protein
MLRYESRVAEPTIVLVSMSDTDLITARERRQLPVGQPRATAAG